LVGRSVADITLLSFVGRDVAGNRL